MLIGCSSDGEPTQAASSTTSAAIGTSAPRPEGLHAKWSAKFDALNTGDGGAKCTEARPKSQTCVAHLTEIVTLALDLRSEITGRPDASAYVETLVQIEKLTDASESYAKCVSGCYPDALAIGLAPVNLTLRLQLDDPVQQR